MLLTGASTDQRNSKTRCKKQRPSLLKQKPRVAFAGCSALTSSLGRIARATRADPRCGWHLAVGSAGSSPEHFVFLSSREVSSSRPVTSTLVGLQQYQACFPPGELHFAPRDGSAHQAAALLWQISAWCYLKKKKRYQNWFQFILTI